MQTANNDTIEIDLTDARRLLYFIQPDVRIIVQVKPEGSFQYYTVAEAAEWIIPRNWTIGILKKLEAFLENQLNHRIARSERVRDDATRFPEAIIQHADRLTRKCRVRLNRVKTCLKFSAILTAAVDHSLAECESLAPELIWTEVSGDGPWKEGT